VDVALEDDVVEESRLSRLESDVSHMQGDIADLKTDVREMRKDIAALKSDGADLRSEMCTGFAALRGETQAGDAALRLEMEKGFGKTDEALGTLEKALQRTSLNDRIWMLLTAAAILSVMAHGFKWI
jgi:predicted RNase H-like nuclease (RuvC/YqgF family)